jgi:hypothetical protein
MTVYVKRTSVLVEMLHDVLVRDGTEEKAPVSSPVAVLPSDALVVVFRHRAWRETTENQRASSGTGMKLE